MLQQIKLTEKIVVTLLMIWYQPGHSDANVPKGKELQDEAHERDAGRLLLQPGGGSVVWLLC